MSFPTPGSIAGWVLEPIRSLAESVFSTLGPAHFVVLIFAAALLCSLAANAMKLISQPKGIAFSGAALLAALGLVWLVPPVPKTVVVNVREVIREIDPPVLGTIQTQVARLEKDTQRQKGELAAQVEAAGREAEGRAKAEARLRVLEKQLAAAAQKPKTQAKKPAANGECVACGHLMHVGRGLAGESIRCHNCRTIMSARSAWARRAFTLNVEAGRIKKPNRPAPPMYADLTYQHMFE